MVSNEEIIKDYRLGFQSRQASLIGRKEVLGGKAKFGIFGDGKEVAQLAMARHFKKGDIRSGYYRDQTWAFSLEVMNIKQWFAQLYSDPFLEREPHTGGRQMNSHFATRFLNEDGSWKNLTTEFHSSADASPTGSQMPRLVGLAQASKFYREFPHLQSFNQFSDKGNEVMWGTIGNASCAEGLFFEAMNAIGVLQVPVVMSVWDDGYGISVPNYIQITKSSISEILKGFQRDENNKGFEIFVTRGWDYVHLMETYQRAAEVARNEHVPCLVHVIEVTQPQGHSTSGDHRRYKTKERLQWEEDFDCILKMRAWILEKEMATVEQLDEWEKADLQEVRRWQKEAQQEYYDAIAEEAKEFIAVVNTISAKSQNAAKINEISAKLNNDAFRKIDGRDLFRRDIMEAAQKIFLFTKDENIAEKEALRTWKKEQDLVAFGRYNDCLYSGTALNIKEIKAIYSDESPEIPGSQVLNKCFDSMFETNPLVVAFGEDVGHIGDVNQAFAGLQSKYGVDRIADTGIREATIMGQAIGLAMRGLRPIAEIQYLDYLLFGFQTLSDDLATLRWRTKGGQKAPAIIRTRGHRLEGVWHAGSPIGMIINGLKGMYVLVPRNMTQAAGFYNTLMQADEPALVIEVLNGYRLRERLPDNISEFTLPLGVPEILREGNAVTVVTYGACCRVAMETAEQLSALGIEIEVIDVQSLIPFDRHGIILESLKKTNRIVFFDEDFQGGATAFMMQNVLEVQGGYHYLDSEPKTVAAQDNRTAYGMDGDYWSKPQVEHLFRAVYELMNEFNPALYPIFY